MNLSSLPETKLTKAQKRALDNISSYAKKRQVDAQEEIDHVLRMTNIAPKHFQDALHQIQTHARIGLHFHPDRPGPDGKTVAEGLLEDGVYKSQFETLLSNGSVSAFPGGHRDLWEQKIFFDAYHVDGADNTERPKYGSLDLMRHPDGPSPRFGCCYVLLKPSVSHRCTFTYLDSHTNPLQKGTLEVFEDILASLLNDALHNEFAIGERNLTVGKLMDHLRNHLHKPISDLTTSKANRNLNHYIEAQVHGDILLGRDAEMLVADPSFRDTRIGQILKQLADTYALQLHWHMGFSLSIEKVPDNFRGPTMPSLARRIASDGVLNVRHIGTAAQELAQNPQKWADRGTYKEVLQELKLLWHVLVKCGYPY
ncbi:MAG: DUF3626 domain-containing protein [Bacteroidota bacterium]